MRITYPLSRVRLTNMRFLNTVSRSFPLLLLLPIAHTITASSSSTPLYNGYATPPKLSNSIAVPTPCVAPTATSSTVDPWYIDPTCLPGTAHCHFNKDKFRWCNQMGTFVANPCGKDQICCESGSLKVPACVNGDTCS